MGDGSNMFPGLDEHDAHGQTLAELFALSPHPPLPDGLTPKMLREAIASALARVSARELAEECVHFGLPAEQKGEDGPWQGKWRYVERRIRHWRLPELLQLGRDVAAVYDDNRDLNHLLGLGGPGGVRGEMKNLIFAADGPKPWIVLRDAINNDLEIVENAENCLIYDRPLADAGLTWRQLTAWWARNDSLDGEGERAAARALYARLLKSMDRNGAKRFVFEEYCARYGTHGFDIPALIPQVYLHYDPYTRWAGGTLDRQRMDFLLLLDRRRRVVLEVGGVQHYTDREGRASPARYAEMVSADRGLRLAGYEGYRFGGHEIADRSRAAGCPARGGAGTLEGDDSSDRSYNYEYEDEEHGPVSVWATVTVPADYFSCPTCHLVLDRYDLIEQAGLPTTFEAIDDHPPQEPDYGND